MDNQTYLAESMRTLASSEQFLDKVPADILLGAIRDYIDITRRLDLIKKSLFYGLDFDIDAAAFSPSVDTEKSIHAVNPHLLHAAIGLATETGEIMEALERTARGELLDDINMREEIGDIEWYLAIVYREMNTSPEAEKARNIAKLRAAYPERFTPELARERDHETERRILQGEYGNTEKQTG